MEVGFGELTVFGDAEVRDDWEGPIGFGLGAGLVMTLTDPVGFPRTGEPDPMGLLASCRPTKEPLGLVEVGVVVTEPTGFTDAAGVTLTEPPISGVVLADV